MIHKEFTKLLKDKKIARVRNLTKEEMDDFMWYKNPAVVVFTDGSQLILQSDDEGNDGGAAFFYGDKGKVQETIYTT